MKNEEINDKKYSLNHKDKIKEYKRDYYNNNKDKIRLKHKEYYLKYRDRKLKYAQQYRLNNKDKIKEYKLINKHKISIQRKGYNLKNKDKIKEYLLKNKERISRKRKEYESKNKIRRKRYFKQYRIKNRDRIRDYSNERIKKNIKLRISRNFSKGIWESLNKNKNGKKWESLVGYSLNDLKNHLQKQFTERMSWNNYGVYWHIDHRIPQSKFKFNSYEDKQFKECWALENLQPLESKKNVSKINRYSEPTLNQILKISE